MVVSRTPIQIRMQFCIPKPHAAPTIIKTPDIIKNVIHRIPTRRWDGDSRCWIIDKESNLYTDGRNSEWYITELVRWIQRHQFLDVQFVEEEDDSSLPSSMPTFEGEHYMKLEPYPYQLEGVQYALEKKRCIFGDEPGLGKTLQAICSVVKAHKEAAKYGESFPVLVVCPASLKINWQREFLKFAGMQSVVLYDGVKQTWQRYIEMNMAQVIITNYESLKKYFVKEVKGRLTMKNIVFDERAKLFNSIIIDESHKCKSSKTQQSKFVEGLSKGKRFVFELTGTPVVNNNTDLYQQLKILGRLEDFGGYRYFHDRYCDGYRQSSHTKELNVKLWQNCFFRREKANVLTQLPDKTRQYIECEISNRKEYHDAELDLLGYLRKYKDASDEKLAAAERGAIIVKMGILKQISARGKVTAVKEFVQDIIDAGQKVIIFAYLKEVVEELKKAFPKAVTVTGSDNVTQKQKAVDSFQTNDSTKVIILNYKSGGTGLTLTAASRVVFIEFPWTYADCCQAEDRAHRNGQKNNVNCYYFLGEKTIDRYLYKIIQTKKKVANDVVGQTTQIDEDIVKMTFDLFKEQINEDKHDVGRDSEAGNRLF